MQKNSLWITLSQIAPLWDVCCTWEPCPGSLCIWIGWPHPCFLLGRGTSSSCWSSVTPKPPTTTASITAQTAIPRGPRPRRPRSRRSMRWGPEGGPGCLTSEAEMQPCSLEAHRYAFCFYRSTLYSIVLDNWKELTWNGFWRFFPLIKVSCNFSFLKIDTPPLYTVYMSI